MFGEGIVRSGSAAGGEGGSELVYEAVWVVSGGCGGGGGVSSRRLGVVQAGQGGRVLAVWRGDSEMRAGQVEVNERT